MNDISDGNVIKTIFCKDFAYEWPRGCSKKYVIYFQKLSILETFLSSKNSSIASLPGYVFLDIEEEEAEISAYKSTNLKALSFLKMLLL